MKKSYGWMIGLALLSFAVFGLFLSVAPEQIPVHYDMYGNIDRWGSKYEYLLMPGSSMMMCLFMLTIAHLEGKGGRAANETVLLISGIWVQLLFNALWIFFMYKAVQGTDLSVGAIGEKLILLLVMASLIPLGNIMPKAQRNAIFGLRTKWSMADDVCWQKSQRFGGFLMAGVGISGVILVSILPDVWGAYAVMILIVLMIPAAILGSYRIWKKQYPTL